MRPKVFACRKRRGDGRKLVRPDDPGGVGRQIAREVTACPDCARRASAEATRERDAERPHGTVPFILKVCAGRAPPLNVAPPDGRGGPSS